MTGSEPDWSSQHFDDSGWPTIQVPSCWINESLGSYFNQGWYRTSITFDQVPQEDKYIYFGRIYSSDKLFFNGVFIGGHGQFFPDLIDAHEAVRLYKIPKHLVQQGVNSIALNVQSSFPAAGLVHTTPQFGDYDEMIHFQMNKVQKIRDYEVVAVSFFCSLVASFSFLC